MRIEDCRAGMKILLDEGRRPFEGRRSFVIKLVRLNTIDVTESSGHFYRNQDPRIFDLLPMTLGED